MCNRDTHALSSIRAKDRPEFSTDPTAAVEGGASEGDVAPESFDRTFADFRLNMLLLLSGAPDRR